jgi:RecA-family ATPase
VSNSLSPYDQAKRYVDAIPGAVSGDSGHAQTFSVACALIHGFALPRSDARAILSEYSQRCQPAWSEREQEHKLTQAETTQTHQKPRGHLLSKSISHTFRDSTPRPVHSVAPTVKPERKAKRYEPCQDEDLPKPIAYGAVELLRAAFEPGEGVRICPARLGDDGRGVPKDEGIVLSREEWLKKFEKSGPNGVFNPARHGIFISVNPMKLGGSRDSDVTAFRHALIECDSISQIEQWRHISGSSVPVTAVINSGGKSVHAWVRVDAKDRTDYAERVRVLHDVFLANGYKLDEKNKNPSRFSRLPDCVRDKKRQELIALKIGAESFGAWHSELESESIGRVVTIDALRKFKAEDDASCLIGARWLCRGGSCLFVGPSGVGKSSLSVQAAISWALGRSFFGIAPRRPLKSVFIQAENDDGDLAEMVQGVLSALGIEEGTSEDKQVMENVVFISDASRTGEAFTKNVQRIVDRYRQDLCWFDPMLSFIGDDISKQSVCSQFLRNWLAPISESSGVTWMVMHHAGKPKEDKQGKKNWTKTDHSYAGLGSSEIVNWARAVCVLDRVDEKNFSLLLAKRGKRAGALDKNGNPTERLWLQHAENRIEWIQIDEPPAPSKKEKTNRKFGVARDEKHKTPGDPKLIDQIREHLPDFFRLWTDGEKLSLRAAGRKLENFAIDIGVPIKERTAINCIEQMIKEAKLTSTKNEKGHCEVSL